MRPAFPASAQPQLSLLPYAGNRSSILSAREPRKLPRRLERLRRGIPSGRARRRAAGFPAIRLNGSTAGDGSRCTSIQFLKPECVQFSDHGRNVYFVFHCEAARVRIEFMMARTRTQADAIRSEEHT